MLINIKFITIMVSILRSYFILQLVYTYCIIVFEVQVVYNNS